MTTLLTDRQIRFVKESYLLIKPMQQTVAKLFYARLFELDPALRPLFKSDMKEQGRKLMSMIGTAVASLHCLDRLIPALKELGSRHRNYGVTGAHFETVGSALIWTLSRGLGKEFNPETREAWTEVYATLSEVMKSVLIEQPAPEKPAAMEAPASAGKPVPPKTSSLLGRLAHWFGG